MARIVATFAAMTRDGGLAVNGMAQENRKPRLVLGPLELSPCVLWAWTSDNHLFVTARHRTSTENASYALYSRAHAILTRVSRDVVALARGTSQSFDWRGGEDIALFLSFAPPVELLLPREDLIAWIDGWREAILRVLSGAVLLLRAATRSEGNV